MVNTVEILHLEDFSNEVILPTLPVTNSDTSLRTITPDTSPAMKSLFGEILSIRTQAWNNGSPRRSVGIEIHTCENNVYQIQSSSSHNSTWNPVSPSRPEIMLMFTLSGIAKLSERVILSMDIQVTGSRSGGFGIRTQGSGYPMLLTLGTISKKSRLELIFENGQIKTWLNGRNLTLVDHNSLNFSMGLTYGSANEDAGICNVQISNFTVIQVPKESKVRRLSNTRVVRSLASNVNDTPIDEDNPSPINNLDIINGQGLTVDQSNTIAFASPVLRDKERILGSQTTMAIKSTTADTVHTDILDGDTSLNPLTIEVSSVLKPRVVLGDTTLGPNVEDYENFSVQVNVEDLEEG